MKGKDISIPKGTEVTSFVQGDMTLDLPKLAAASAGPATTAPATLVATVATASLTVESAIAGADIDVDDAFVGSTPSTVSVATGLHTITVKKKGYLDSSRKMNVSGSSVRINADLELLPSAQ